MITNRSIAVTTHGRYLVAAPDFFDATIAPPLLVGCHGYAENAEIQLDRLRSIPGTASWLMISVQGLHRFYRGRSEDVVASWMTRQDRELAIADTVGYIAAVVDAASREWGTSSTLVFAGFSQGVGAAFRAAAASPRRAHVIALGGDIPPELERDGLAKLAGVLIGRGVAYTIHLRQLLLIYCLLLPFQLVRDLGLSTGLFSALISFTLFGIEQIGLEIENPFGYDHNDLPLDNICDIIKNDIEDFIFVNSNTHEPLKK